MVFADAARASTPAMAAGAEISEVKERATNIRVVILANAVKERRTKTA
jgi:hypothetical protein